MECEFCKHVFANNSSLNTHKKTAKYCLRLRNKDVNDYKCENCCRTFSRLSALNRHNKICKVGNIVNDMSNTLDEKTKKIEMLERSLEEYKCKYDTLLEEYTSLKLEHKRDIQVLQDKLENVAIQAARKPTQTTNTYNNRNQINTVIQNLHPVTEESFESHAKNLTIEHLKKGVKGYVEYALNYPLKDRVLCVDYARRKIKYKDKDGKVQTDPEMNKLSQKFFESIRDKNKALALKCVDSLADEMDARERINIIADMAQLMTDVSQSASGQKNDFTHDFVRGVCSERVC
jgi:hypothetical protein